jgi:putative sigma-54 modulation protein
MNIEVKDIHFAMDSESREYLNKKIARIHNAESMITDLLFSITKDSKDYAAEATVNFRWGVSVHVKEQDFGLNPAIDKLMDKLEQKITKEKEKFKDKRAG